MNIAGLQLVAAGPSPASNRWSPILLGVAACFAVAGQPAFSQEGPPVSSEQTQTGAPSVPQSSGDKPAAAPDGASGMTIYIDPQTGAVVSQPGPGTVPLQLTPEQQKALSTSHEGLVEVPGTEPGGGIKLDLQGRFQSPLVLTIDANGRVKMQHVGELPESGNK